MYAHDTANLIVLYNQRMLCPVIFNLYCLVIALLMMLVIFTEEQSLSCNEVNLKYEPHQYEKTCFLHL